MNPLKLPNVKRHVDHGPTEEILQSALT